MLQGVGTWYLGGSELALQGLGWGLLIATICYSWERCQQEGYVRLQTSSRAVRLGQVEGRK